MATSKVLTAVVSRSLATTGSSVTTPQLRVLVMLSSHGPVNLTAVALALGVNASNASRTCDQLVTGRLVVRREDPDDRRHIVLTLSPSGAALVEKLMAHRRTLFTAIVDCMGSKDRASLVRGLEAFLRAADTLSAADDVTDESGHLLSWLT